MVLKKASIVCWRVSQCENIEYYWTMTCSVSVQHGLYDCTIELLCWNLSAQFGIPNPFEKGNISNDCSSLTSGNHGWLLCCNSTGTSVTSSTEQKADFHIMVHPCYDDSTVADSVCVSTHVYKVLGFAFCVPKVCFGWQTSLQTSWSSSNILLVLSVVPCEALFVLTGYELVESFLCALYDDSRYARLPRVF